MAEIPDPWADPIIVTTPESEDGTAAAAWRFTAWPDPAPRAAPGDTARTFGSEPASGAWVFHLDPEERVPAALGEALQRRVEERGGASETGSEGEI